jgi:sialate O-acetylesterase
VHKSLLFLLLYASSLPAQRLTIVSGAVEGQFFQRDQTDHIVVNLTGTAVNLNNRQLEIRALDKWGPLATLDWAPAGKVEKGKWAARITLPTGGPYRIEVRSMKEVETLRDIFVGDLWVLAGQSNMEGVGNLIDTQPTNGLVRTFDMFDRWGIAEEPLHVLPGAVDRVHWRRSEGTEPQRLEGQPLLDWMANRKKGAGLGLPFAAEMVRKTGVPIGLVPCAHGGTSMDQWSPDLRDKAGDSLYGATLRRVKAVGGKVKGVLWYQGESDANPKAMPEFAAKFQKLIAAFREDLGDKELPFYYVQIGRHANGSNVTEWNAVQDAQRKAEQTIARIGMVPAVDLELDDGIHVGTQDLKRLGIRMASLACHDLFPRKADCNAIKRGPRPGEAKFQENVVRVQFNEVNGRLHSQGRIAGFTIHDATGALLPLIYRVRFDPDNPYAVLLHVNTKPPSGATLRYGAGKDPYLNLNDSRDMGVPVFSIPIQ